MGPRDAAAGDYTAPLGARFLTALADRLGAGIGSVDALLAARAHGGGSSLGLLTADDRTHHRVRRADRYRDDVRVWQTGDGAGCLILGRGLARRWEVAFEVEPQARGHGVGRALAAAALGLLPAGTPVFAQVAPGNSVSTQGDTGRRVCARRRRGAAAPPGLTAATTYRRGRTHLARWRTHRA